MMPRERLTPKEVQVATLVWEGLTNREIGKIIDGKGFVTRAKGDYEGALSLHQQALSIARSTGDHDRRQLE